MVDYNPFAKTFSESRKNMKWPELDAILSDILQNKYQKIVDLGCGNGRFVEQCLSIYGELSFEYLGVDASSFLLSEAKNSFPNQEFCISTMQDFVSILANKDVDLCRSKNLQNFEKFFSQKFDAIVFLASFHHLQRESERIKVLENAKKILSPNGKIYMTNWNLLPQEKYQKFYKWNGDFDIKIGEYFRYYHGFSLKELENIFQKTGFSIEKNEIFEGGRNIFSILKH